MYNTPIPADNQSGELMKKTILAIFMGILLVFGVQATNITFSVIETGIPRARDVARHSILWENAFFDVFFDAGYIVGNLPILSLESKPTDDIFYEAGFDVYEARDVGIDYMIITQLDYFNDFQTPAEISFFIFRITPHETLFERKIAGKEYRTEREAYDDIIRIVRELVPLFRNF